MNKPIVNAVVDRRSFVRSENLHLGRFLDAEHLVGWHRSYRCECCGFRCTSPGEMWDHVLVCQAEFQKL